MDVTVARIGRAHGLKGEVSVELHTDIPHVRFAAGAVLDTDPTEHGPLTVNQSRTQGGRWYVRFDTVTTREAAEALRGVQLLADADAAREDNAWYTHELLGLEVRRVGGEVIGTVTDVEHPAQTLLVVAQPGGQVARIPLVEALVPEVNVSGGYVVVDPPYGLLAGEEPEQTGETRG